MRKRLVVIFAISCMAAMAAAGTATAGGGNSGAALECQQGGYLNMQGSDGSTFKNVGDCISYFAQDGTAGTSACSYTPGGATGCMTFDVLLTSTDGSETMTLNGAFSFSTTACEDPDVLVLTENPCTPVPNDLATGGGTYTIYHRDGTVADEGTFSAGNAANTEEGLWGSYFADADNATEEESCSQATLREVSVVASTSDSTSPFLEVAAGTGASGQQLSGVVVIDGGESFVGPSTGLSITC